MRPSPDLMQSAGRGKIGPLPRPHAEREEYNPSSLRTLHSPLAPRLSPLFLDVMPLLGVCRFRCFYEHVLGVVANLLKALPD